MFMCKAVKTQVSVVFANKYAIARHLIITLYKTIPCRQHTPLSRIRPVSSSFHEDCETDSVCIGSSQHGLGRRARAAVSQTCILPPGMFDSRASRSFEPILLMIHTNRFAKHLHFTALHQATRLE